MVVSLYVTVDMRWSGHSSVCEGHDTDVPRTGMCTAGFGTIRSSSYDGAGPPHYAGSNTCEDLLVSLRPIRVDHTEVSEVEDSKGERVWVRPGITGRASSKKKGKITG